MSLSGLDAWIEGEGVCTYCGQRSCVCETDEPEEEFFSRGEQAALEAEADYYEGKLRGDA